MNTFRKFKRIINESAAIWDDSYAQLFYNCSMDTHCGLYTCLNRPHFRCVQDETLAMYDIYLRLQEQLD